MNIKKNNGIQKTNYWTKGKEYIPMRSAQSFVNPVAKAKAVANSECESGCSSCPTSSCASGCTDF